MRLLLALILSAWAGAVAAAPATCDGYPRAPIETARGVCAGLVVTPLKPGRTLVGRTLRLPRTLMMLSATEALVVDLGSWEAGHGAVWRLSAPPGVRPALTRVLSGLDLPHTLARGPDGAVYLGEMSRIVRFDPAAAEPRAMLSTVVAGLPDNRLHENRHPLSSFVFAPDGALIVNVGAPSDQCPPKPGETTCAEAEGPRAAGALWRFAYRGDGLWDAQPTIYARGLRNSLALAVAPDGAVLQAENSIDVPDPAWPREEINLVRPGRDHGWPYCVDAGRVAPAWRGVRRGGCAASERPLAFLPAHSAPMALAYYDGTMFPELKGRLLVSLHGYRSTGSRLAALATDVQGRPAPNAAPLQLATGWRAVKGVRSAGSPVGIAVAPDGAIWVTDDRNGQVLRFARTRP